ncbi:MAG: hypothetical protein K0B06_04485 [Brevefilum sp.]|nr:hypothetical protein [Brevefilum sp.]
MKPRQLLIFLLIIFLNACNIGPFASEGGQNITHESQAKAALVEFFALLSQGEYEKAVELYGGSYEELEYFNPGMDPDDKSGLLTAACEFNGFICLPVLSLAAIDADLQDILVFEVAYANPDGSRFVLGPCCGATEEEMPPVDVFTVRVNCEEEGVCQVLDLPPYVP